MANERKAILVNNNTNLVAGSGTADQMRHVANRLAGERVGASFTVYLEGPTYNSRADVQVTDWDGQVRELAPECPD